MGTILTNSQNYTDIAAAIRAKKNVSTTYKPNQMAAAIQSIPSVDVSSDTVVPSKLVVGYTAHNSSGQQITGTMQTVGGAGLTWSQLTSTAWGLISSDSPRPNVFDLNDCVYEQNIVSHTQIGDHGCSFTISQTTQASVYFVLDPTKTYDVHFWSQNCILVGYNSDWSTIVFVTPGSDGYHTLTNITNVEHCYIYVSDTTVSYTGTFQDMTINEM